MRRRDELRCLMLAAVVGLLHRGFKQLQQLLRYLPRRGYDLDGDSLAVEGCCTSGCWR